ncbi:hypothetical protein AMEX_G10745 [Astyanax mexicanus]|uniref:Immunoglobulin V-set domain-containing protein n=1 Tax=Astyanax mexicanus TaxID=7994 RepID=A0A8T2LVX0_ASTMX|nr:hypothetical protein AMEX_G10745 [Astyanax mexicanus]
MWISGAVVLLLSGCAAAQITYAKDWEVARSGRTPIIKCTVDSSTSLSSTTLHLYQGKPEGDMRRIMHFPAGSQSATLDKEIPRRFNAVIREQTVSLTISRVQPEDAAVYYCALWKGDTVLNCSSGAVHKPGPRPQYSTAHYTRTAPT